MAGGALSFREDPFRLMPDRRFIFSTDSFRQAFDGMLDAIRRRRNIALLTGPSGTGKTTLLQALQEEVQRDGAIVFLRFHPDISGDLLTSCLVELGSAKIPTEEAARLRIFAALVKAGTRVGGPPAVLVIDEAGQFSDAQLIDVYRLVAPGQALAGVLQVVLAALPSFEERLQQSGLVPLQHAISHRSRLQPLRADELGGYIAHRCSVAGLAGAGVFETAAIGRVYEITRGTPRLVNRLCSTALFVARDTGSDRVSAAIVDQAATGGGMAEAPAARAAEATRADADRKAAPHRDTAAAKPAAATPPPPRPGAHPRMRPSATPEDLTLAEAERAWVRAVLPPIPEPSASPQAAPIRQGPAPAPAVLELTEPAPPVLELSDPAPPVLELSEPLDEQAPAAAARRRMPALRIAASIALLATSGAAIGALYWQSADHSISASAGPAASQAADRIAPAASAAPATSATTAQAEAPPAATAQPATLHAATDTTPAASEPISATHDTAKVDGPAQVLEAAISAQTVSPVTESAPVVQASDTAPAAGAKPPQPPVADTAQASIPAAQAEPVVQAMETTPAADAEPPQPPAADTAHASVPTAQAEPVVQAMETTPAAAAETPQPPAPDTAQASIPAAQAEPIVQAMETTPISDAETPQPPADTAQASVPTAQAEPVVQAAETAPAPPQAEMPQLVAVPTTQTTNSAEPVEPVVQATEAISAPPQAESPQPTDIAAAQVEPVVEAAEESPVPPPAESQPPAVVAPPLMAAAPGPVVPEPQTAALAVPTAPLQLETPSSPPQSSSTEIAASAARPAPQPAHSASAVEPAAGPDSPEPQPATAAPSAGTERIETVATGEKPSMEALAPSRDAVRASEAQRPAPPPAVQSAPQLAQAPAAAPADAAAPAELAQLMARGDEMLRLGDPASARLFYERAAMRGLARAYTAVGRTYDPTVLRQLNIRGGGANGERALEWYRRGAEAGDAEAGRIASDLSAWLARPR